MSTSPPKDPDTKPCHHSRAPLPLHAPKQQQGHVFEQHACTFLEAQGLLCLAQNWQQAGAGEIDLIMLERGAAWDTVVFVEVRQRRVSRYGDALSSVTRKKQQKIIKTARHFLQQHPQYAEYDCRFDVLGYDATPATATHYGSEPTSDVLPLWVQGAFMADAW